MEDVIVEKEAEETVPVTEDERNDSSDYKTRDEADEVYDTGANEEALPTSCRTIGELLTCKNFLGC
jgi:hypothetical protein